MATAAVWVAGAAAPPRTPQTWFLDQQGRESGAPDSTVQVMSAEGKDDMAEGKRQLEAERAKQARDVTAAFFRGVCREVHAARSVDEEEPPNVAQAGASPPLSPKKAPTASLVSVLRNAGPSIPAASAPGGGGSESGEGKRVSFDTNIHSVVARHSKGIPRTVLIDDVAHSGLW